MVSVPWSCAPTLRSALSLLAPDFALLAHRKGTPHHMHSTCTMYITCTSHVYHVHSTLHIPDSWASQPISLGVRQAQKPAAYGQFQKHVRETLLQVPDMVIGFLLQAGRWQCLKKNVLDSAQLSLTLPSGSVCSVHEMGTRSQAGFCLSLSCLPQGHQRPQ